MGIFGIIKDLALLPVDLALDCTGITPIGRILNDSKQDTPFGTIDRLKSLGNNLDDTLD